MTAATARALDFDGPNTRLQPRRSEELQHGSLARLHLIAPSQRQINGVGAGDVPIGNDPKTSVSSPYPKHETRTALQRALTLHVTEQAKVTARKIDASPDTVEAHRQNVPKSWAALIAYCRAYPAFGLEVLELMGIDIDRDRDAYAIFLSLQRQMQGSAR